MVETTGIDSIRKYRTDGVCIVVKYLTCLSLVRYWYCTKVQVLVLVHTAFGFGFGLGFYSVILILLFVAVISLEFLQFV